MPPVLLQLIFFLQNPDPSPHKLQFIAVEQNVHLEVLDWGGSGRPLILLPGLGGTAHFFDDLAPRLTAIAHVYAITRRGYGASSTPATGYDADRLGDDVLAVIDSLKLQQPVLAGFSLAGEELSSASSRHPGGIAGLIYLDAAYPYAFDNGKGMTMGDLFALLQNAPTPPAPDLSSPAVYRKWLLETTGVATPEAEIRQLIDFPPGGTPGKLRTKPSVPTAILSGTKKFTAIQAPVLALFADPPALPPWMKDLSFQAREEALVERQAKALEEAVPGARVVRLPQANHWLIASHEATVLGEIQTFLTTLNWIGKWELNISKSTFGTSFMPGAPADLTILGQTIDLKSGSEALRLTGDTVISYSGGNHVVHDDNSLKLDGSETTVAGALSLSFHAVDDLTFDILSKLNVPNRDLSEVSRFTFSSDGQTMTETKTQTERKVGDGTVIRRSTYVLAFDKAAER